MPIFPEGDTALVSDDEKRSLIKIVELMSGGSGGGGTYPLGGNFYGNGDPNGVVTASRGAIYTDELANVIYTKTTDSSNTGWV